jgi:hypothetical protein
MTLLGAVSKPTSALRLLSAEYLPLARSFRLADFGRVEPKRTQGCLPKCCHSLNLGMENFARILSGRFWPFDEVASDSFIAFQLEESGFS